MTERRSPRGLVLLCALLALTTAALSLALLLDEGGTSGTETGEEVSAPGQERNVRAGLDEALKRVRNLEAALVEAQDRERGLLLERERLEAVLASEASRVTELEILVDELDGRLRGSDPRSDSSRQPGEDLDGPR